MSVVNIPFAKAQHVSNGADNFYTSDKVTLQKVTFKNQCKKSGDRRRASDGSGEGAKRKSVRHENG